jgi:hypothetical protein
MRVSGQSMMDLGIFNNDIVVVRRGRRPRDGHIVVATVDGEFTVKQLYKKFGKIKLRAANPDLSRHRSEGRPDHYGVGCRDRLDQAVSSVSGDDFEEKTSNGLPTLSGCAGACF